MHARVFSSIAPVQCIYPSALTSLENSEQDGELRVLHRRLSAHEGTFWGVGGALCQHSRSPPPSGRGLTSTGGGVGGEQGTDGRVAKDRRWVEGGRRVDGGVHSFSNSHSFEEFTVEIGTLP